MLNQQRLKADISRSVREALAEDLGSTDSRDDITAQLVSAETQYRAKVITREPAVICGVDWVNETFAQLDASYKPIRWLKQPPQVTAYFCAVRKPGMVLRVSNNLTELCAVCWA